MVNLILKFYLKIKKNTKKEQLTQFHMDIASSIQKVTEKIIIKMCRYIKKI